MGLILPLRSCDAYNPISDDTTLRRRIRSLVVVFYTPTANGTVRSHSHYIRRDSNEPFPLHPVIRGSGKVLSVLHSPSIFVRFDAASLPRGRALASLYSWWDGDSLGYISTRTVVVLAYTVTVICSARRTSIPSLSSLTSRSGPPSRQVYAAG